MENVSPAVKIENMGVFDLTGSYQEDLADISVIRNIGVILVPQSLTHALMKIPQENVGMTVTLPDTQAKVKVFTGQLSLSGEVFANNTGSSEDILVIAGQVIITSPIEKIGYKEIIVAGQLISPKKSEAELTQALTKLTGQIGYYHSENPRLFVGDDKFSKEFFEYIEDKISMVLIGDYEIEADVDASLLKQKISELIIIGDLTAPKALIPLLQFLAATKLGDISAKEGTAVQDGQ